MKNDEKRKPGELIRTFGDFWLGMVGAAAKGISTFSKARRDEKNGRDANQDFFTNAAVAVGAMFHEASQVASETKEEIRNGNHGSAQANSEVAFEISEAIRSDEASSTT